ncbi:hypothetical protein LguiB_034560 [Lonicera macranthoides]
MLLSALLPQYFTSLFSSAKPTKNRTSFFQSFVELLEESLVLTVVMVDFVVFTKEQSDGSIFTERFQPFDFLVMCSLLEASFKKLLGDSPRQNLLRLRIAAGERKLLNDPLDEHELRSSRRLLSQLQISRILRMYRVGGRGDWDAALCWERLLWSGASDCRGLRVIQIFKFMIRSFVPYTFSMPREPLVDFYTSFGQWKLDNNIIFRDGVSESQFNQVLNIELDQIIEVFI